MLKDLEGDCQEKGKKGYTRWRDLHVKSHGGVKQMVPLGEWLVVHLVEARVWEPRGGYFGK